MARLWQAGPHLNSTTAEMEFTTISGTLSISTANLRVGPFAMRTNPTAGTSFARQVITLADNSTSVFFRVYAYFVTLPSADSTMIRIVNTGNSPGAQLRYIASTQKFVLLDAGSTPIGSASATIVANTWYRLELNLDASSSPGSVTGKLDGTTFATGANSSQFPWSKVLWGSVSTVTTDVYWTDMALNDASGALNNSWPGVGAVIALFPNATGDANGWNNTTNTAGGVNNYQLVDENPPNDATDMVQSVTLNAEDMYNMTASGIGASDIVNSVMIGGRYRNNTADLTTAVKWQVKKTSGGTIQQSAASIVNDTAWQTNTPQQPRNYPIIMTVDPDGAAWTQATLDTMQVGQKITAAGTNRIQVTSVWASVDFTPSSTTPISSSDTGAGVDATSLAATTSSADTGAGTDATALSAATSAAETGSGADTTPSLSAATSSAETGSGADAGSVTASLSQADTGAGADVATLTAAQSNGDTAAGAENASLIVFAADTGAGADATSLTAATSSGEIASSADVASLTVLASETASGTDATSLTVTQSNGDTAAGAENASLTVFASDTGAGAEATSLVVATSSGETASGVDAASLNLSSSDTASGVDATSVAVTQSSAETASGTDTASVAAAQSNGDIGSSTDATGITASISAADTASGAETQSVDQDTVPVSASDTASGVDVTSLSVSVAVGESGTSSDTTTDRTLGNDDSGATADLGSVNAALTAEDTTSAADAEALGINTSDVGSGVDVVSDLSVTISVTDSATGLDSAPSPGDDFEAVFAADTATGTDTQAVQLGAAPDDSADASESASVFVAVLVSDFMTGTEGVPRVEISASDTASAADSAVPLAHLSVTESAAGADINQQIQAAISGTDAVAGAEAVSGLNASVSSGDLGDGNETTPIGTLINSGDVVSSNDLSTVNAALVSADLATSFTQSASLAAAIFNGDIATIADGNFVFIDNLFDSEVMDQAFGEDLADLLLDVADQVSALDFAKIVLGVADGASILDFAGVILGVASSDAASVVEVASVSTVRMSSDLIVTADAALVSVSAPASEIVHARDSASVFITPTRSHRVMPYYIREPQGWAIEQERRRHNEALWYVGENTMFVLMWHLEDFMDNLVGRCPTCYESQGRIANVYGQADEYKCPDCFGTTFEGGFKALIVRPAIFSDSDEGETRDRRGVVHPQDLTIESTPDFRIRTGDYCFRVNGDRYYMRVPERITLRTGFGHATQTETAIGYNHANAAVEDPDSVAYMIPPANDEVSQILNRASRIPRDWSTFEIIRAPLIPSSDLIGGP